MFLFMRLGCFGTTRLYGAGQITKKDGALFGPPKSEYNLPNTGTIKTRTQDKSSLSASGERFLYADRRKDNVPAKEDRPIMGITTTKNFVTANAVEAILQGKLSMKSTVCTMFILYNQPHVSFSYSSEACG